MYELSISQKLPSQNFRAISRFNYLVKHFHTGVTNYVTNCHIVVTRTQRWSLAHVKHSARQAGTFIF